MAFYDGVFKALGLSDWCGTEKSDAPMSMADLLAKKGWPNHLVEIGGELVTGASDRARTTARALSRGPARA